MKTLQHQSSLNLARQKGAVLVVSLIILLLMTLIGVASMSSSIMQEKMASNAQNNNATFQAAENAVSGLINKVIIDKD
ncbi:PilX N-terminal domain-containing pilus assembly protein, partial [Oleiphilus sp. HI0061]